jgi:phenylalanyl-tRNA synthetase beta chain
LWVYYGFPVSCYEGKNVEEVRFMSGYKMGQTDESEVDLAAILQRNIPAFAEVSKFPGNRRDLAIVVDQTISADDILRLARKVGGNQVVGINLFDTYQGTGVPDGKKSLAFSIVLQNTERTLEDKEIAETMERVVDALRVEFNATLRD